MSANDGLFHSSGASSFIGSAVGNVPRGSSSASTSSSRSETKLKQRSMVILIVVCLIFVLLFFSSTTPSTSIAGGGESDIEDERSHRSRENIVQLHPKFETGDATEHHPFREPIPTVGGGPSERLHDNGGKSTQVRKKQRWDINADKMWTLPPEDDIEANMTTAGRPRGEPYKASGSEFKVFVNRSVDPPTTYTLTSALDPHTGYFKFPNNVSLLIVEVGTNDEPEVTQLIKLRPDSFLIGFEPQPEIFRRMVQMFPNPERLLAVPAAITPHRAYVPLHVSEHKGCTSLLGMNRVVRRFAAKMKKLATTRGAMIQLRTVEFCAKEAEKIWVPSFPLQDILFRIPPSLRIDILIIDAQGFDTFVVSTVGIHAPKTTPNGLNELTTAALSNPDRINFIVLECQDLSEMNLRLMLVDGAPTCAEQRACVEAVLPHRLESCSDNAPKVRELNCLYRHPHIEMDQLPTTFKFQGGKKIAFPDSSSGYTCPKFI